MVVLESIRGCVSTPRVLFALEEIAIPYELSFRDEGHFNTTYGVAGPLFIDGKLELISVGAILRHIARAYGNQHLEPTSLVHQALVDRWVDFVLVDLSPIMGRLAMLMGAPPESRGALPDVYASAMRMLGFLERELEGREFLSDRFSIFECSMAPLLLAPRLLPDGQFPVLRNYVQRLVERPSWKRVVTRLAR